MVTYVYRVTRARGSNLYGACETVTHCATYASPETATAAAFELARRELAADREELFHSLPNRSSASFARKLAEAEQVANDYYKDLEMNDHGSYEWGPDCDTGPYGSVCVFKDELLP